MKIELRSMVICPLFFAKIKALGTFAMIMAKGMIGNNFEFIHITMVFF